MTAERDEPNNRSEQPPKPSLTGDLYLDNALENLRRTPELRLTDNASVFLLGSIVDCVIVWKYDRFARSLSVLISTLQQFNSLGVDFISYTQHIDTTTPMGRLFFHIIGSFAEFEREMIGERVRAGLAKVRAQGKTLGPPIRDRDAVARIQALRDQGFSLREIARREGYSPAGVLKILRRSKV